MNPLLEIRLRQCVFCKEPLSSWSASILRNFGLFGSDYKYCASWKPLSEDVPNLSHEKSVGASTSESSRFSVNSNNSRRSRKRSSEAHCYPSFNFWFGFGVDRSTFPLMLDLEVSLTMYLPSPATKSTKFFRFA